MLRLAVFDLDGRVNAAAYVEVAKHGHLSRLTGLNQIVENLIDHGFVESSLAAIGPEIELQRFKLDTEFVGHVSDANRRKIRLAGARAHASKLRALHIDFIVALGPRIGKSFQLSARLSRHAAIIARGKCISKSPTYLDLPEGR